MKKILVTDGRSLAALAIIRSFGEKGFEVHCGDDFKNNLSSYSRYVKKRVIYPSPMFHPSEFIDYLLDLTKSEKYDMIFPVRDDITLLLSKYKNIFQKYTNIYLADYGIIKKFCDKGETIRIAQNSNVPVPRTYFPEDTDIENVKNSIQYPVLIRARISSGSRGIIRVNSSTEFDAAYSNVKKEYGEPIIQEYVNKTGYSTACILLDKFQNTIATFSYKRVKEFPITGGPTVVGISCEDPEVIAHSLRMLKNNGWCGVAEVEYILDENGSPLLLEVNPRFWMPLNLSIKSGVDFPYLMYELACGKNINYVGSYTIGLKYRWVFPNEILWLTQTPNKIKGFMEFLNFWDNNTCYSSWSFKDPLASLGVLIQSLSFLFDDDKRKMFFKRGLDKRLNTQNKSQGDLYVDN